MSRDSNRLTALAVTKKKKPGRYGDGGGLWLQVARGGTKQWLLRYQIAGRARQMGLGPVSLVPLAEAREAARAARRLLLSGIDPIEERRAGRLRAQLEAAKGVSFRECAEACIEAHKAGWKNPKHAAQWPATLMTYVYPVIGNLPVSGVDTGLVLKILEPIWLAKPETAGRIRGRIEAVLDWAKARDYRTGDNPARWRGHLDKLLAPRSKVRRVKHHAALPYAELPAFLADLRKQDAIGAKALEFTILTAARTGEVIGAKLSEIDAKGGVWTIPGERMKAGRLHRVPLPRRALELLGDLPSDGDWIFPGAREGRPLSNMTMLKTLERMGRGDLTAHGFRSSFRDWAGEQTAFPREVIEAALAHTLKDKTEAAYQRGDLFDKRRKLMDAWAKYCASSVKGGANVVAIGRKGGRR